MIPDTNPKWHGLRVLAFQNTFQHEAEILMTES
jgi:hypothetical protein